MKPMKNDRTKTDYSMGDTASQRGTAAHKLAMVQQLQTQFWKAVADLETVIGEIRGDDCELDSAKDFNDLDLDDVIDGQADDGEKN